MRDKVSPIIVRIWIAISASLVAANVVVYMCSLIGINLADKYTSINWLFISMFVAVIPALVYCRKLEGRDSGAQGRILQRLPSYMRAAIKGLLLFALVNLAAALVCMHGGEASIDGKGRYVLTNGNHVLRFLTRPEYQRQRSYIQLLTSSFGIAFTYAGFALLVGVARSLHGGQIEEHRAAILQNQGKSRTHLFKGTHARSFVSIGSGCLYVTCYLLLISGQSQLIALCIVPATISALLAIQSRSRARDGRMRNMLGCLSLIPNAFAGTIVADRIAKLLYVLLFVGASAANHGSVFVEFPSGKPGRLSNGTVLNISAWGIITLFVEVPAFALVTIGLTHLAENAGELFLSRSNEVRLRD